MEVTPLRVKITTNAKGENSFPDFNQMQVVKDSPVTKWTTYIDRWGHGWVYDLVTGIKDDNGGDSPVGTMWGVILSTKAFAEQAVALDPEVCSIITEAELDTFFQDRIAPKQMDEVIKTEVLLGIQAKLALGKTLTPDQEDALDPNNERPGIVTNPWKSLANLKINKGMTVAK
jgi:hypothetical protein